MGPEGGDELNLPQPGENYGWPIVSWGEHYDGREQAPDGTVYLLTDYEDGEVLRLVPGD